MKKNVVCANRELVDIRAELNHVLEQRDRLFPRRDPQNTAAMKKLTAAYTEAIKATERSECGWMPDETHVQEAIAMTENSVFICGHKKSGTTFLASLLDGHPQITVLPGDSRMIHRIRTRRDLPYTQRIAEQHSHWLARMINPRGQEPFWFLGTEDRVYVSFSHYLTYWLDRLPIGDRSPFLAAVLALYCANPHRASPRLWVEKTTGNEARVKTILDLYPKARFIHIVRNPMAVIAAIKRLQHYRNCRWSQGVLGAVWYALSQLIWRASGRRIRLDASEGILSSCLSLYRSMYLGSINQMRLGDGRYYLLRYEDLVADPEKEMSELAHFLDISWDTSLLIPTSNGQPTASNSMYEDRRPEHGLVLNQISNQWREELNRAEQRMIRICLHQVSRQRGYSLQ